MDTVVCCTCKEEKSSDRFIKDNRYNSGYNSWCMDCRNENRRKDPEDLKSRSNPPCVDCGTDIETEAISGRNRLRCHLCFLDKIRPYQRANRTMRSHGMTREEYELYVKQSCFSCGDTEKIHRIDHDHSCCPPKHSCSKCRRGALCEPCNKILGFACDSVERLTNLIAYLISWENRSGN